MLTRYTTSKNGRPVKQAEIYTQKEHGIGSSQLDADAVKVILRLQNAGYEAYIVGGAVRDMLLQKIPKDFDIATNARPSRIRKIFRNSRIIGKRFRLAHILFHGGKIIEVSTFRSDQNNAFGSIEDDVHRRDFSVNALYYDPVRRQLLDFVHGLKDLRKGRLRAVIPLNTIFVEDSVRIIRAVKYMVKANLKADFLLSQRIKRQSCLLEQASSSRITEEIYKILESGYAMSTFALLFSFTSMNYILPGLYKPLKRNEKGEGQFLDDLARLDSISEKISDRSDLLYYLIRNFFMNLAPWSQNDRLHFPDVVFDLKKTLQPMVPANKDIETAVAVLLQERGQGPVHRRSRSSHRRRKRRKKHAPQSR